MISMLPRSTSSIVTVRASPALLGDREAPVLPVGQKDCDRSAADARVDVDLLDAPDFLQDSRV
jgi:hypothetical protein